MPESEGGVTPGWMKGAWVMTRKRRRMKIMAEPKAHPDWINDIGHQWVLYHVGRFLSMCSVTHNRKSIYHKRSHWVVRVNWLKGTTAHKRISRADATFLLQLSREEAIEQLEAVYGKRAGSS